MVDVEQQDQLVQRQVGVAAVRLQEEIAPSEVAFEIFAHVRVEEDPRIRLH